MDDHWTFRRWDSTGPTPEYQTLYRVDEEALAAELGITVAALREALARCSFWQLGPDGEWRAVPGWPA